MKMFSQKLILLFIAFFVLACLALPASAEESMDSASGFLCEYAMELYKQGNINDAIYQLKNALALNPEDQTARRYLEKILSEPPALPTKVKKLKQVTQTADSRKKQLNGWLDRAQQDKTQQDRAANELRQSLQYKEGRIKSLNNQLTKVQQEKDSLLNKDNERVKVIKEELDRSLQDRGNQLKQLSSQLDSLKAEIKSKDNMLKKLEDNLRAEKLNFVAKQQEMSLSVQDKQKQLEQLNRQMVQMEKEKRSYQEQSQELQSLKKQYVADLERRDADLKQARLDYENRLLAVGGELRAKELMIQKLKDDKAAMLEQGQKAKQLQIARVEKLMKEIEDIYPDKRELKNQRLEGSQDDISAKNRQLDRIDKLMQEIEEILPKSEVSP